MGGPLNHLGNRSHGLTSRSLEAFLSLSSGDTAAPILQIGTLALSGELGPGS